MNAFAKSIAAAGLALSLGALAAFADAPAPTPGPPSAPPADAPKTISLDQLNKMLESIGFKPVAEKDAKGNVIGVTCKLSADGWNFPLFFTVSPNQQYVWINATLTKLTNLKTVPADDLMKLLQKNDEMGSITFRIVGEQIYLSEICSVNGLTPEQLKIVTGWLETDVQATYALWKPEALGQEAPKPAGTAT